MRSLMHVAAGRICRPKRNGIAARGGLAGDEFPAWATNSRPVASTMANTWQGDFYAAHKLHLDGPAHRRWTAFADRSRRPRQIGNVWEWTRTGLSQSTKPDAAKAAAFRRTPRGGGEGMPVTLLVLRISKSRAGHKGRLASVAPELLPALSPGATPRRSDRYSTNHLGFRCVKEKQPSANVSVRPVEEGGPRWRRHGEQECKKRQETAPLTPQNSARHRRTSGGGDVTFRAFAQAQKAAPARHRRAKENIVVVMSTDVGGWFNLAPSTGHPVWQNAEPDKLTARGCVSQRILREASSYRVALTHHRRGTDPAMASHRWQGRFAGAVASGRTGPCHGCSSRWVGYRPVGRTIWVT